MPSIVLASVTVAASKKCTEFSFVTFSSSVARPTSLSSAPLNLKAIDPLGFIIFGGETTIISGNGIPGSIGAWRTILISLAMPWADNQALLSCVH